MPDIQFAVAIAARSAADAVREIQAAEAAGAPAAWSTIGGAGGDDPLIAFAGALVQTERIVLGSAIIQTWPRHPTVIAQQSLALDSLAPGRFRLGIGPAHEGNMTNAYGVDFSAPLTNLREYLTVLTSLLHTGAVEFEGKQVTARTRLRETTTLPVMASALRPRSYELCGELADGAISWMCPRRYLVAQALPAMRRGAERAQREAPPLVAHVPVAVTPDRASAREWARQQLGNYSRTPFYKAMFAEAGFPDVADGYSDQLLDDLVVSGDEASVAQQLREILGTGISEVMAAPVFDPNDRQASVERVYAAAGRAATGR